MPIHPHKGRRVRGEKQISRDSLTCAPGVSRKSGDTGTSDPGMIGYTLPEIRRLLISLVHPCAPDPESVWCWSRWCRRRQYQARLSHYRRRGYSIT